MTLCVICLSVYQDVLWLAFRSYGKTFCSNNQSFVFKRRHTKFQRSSTGGTFSNLGLNEKL